MRPPAPSIGVFAVEDTTVQLTWRHLAPGALRLRVAGTGVDVDLPEPPTAGATVLRGLAPGRQAHVLADGPALGRRGPVELVTTTLPALPGAELVRVATVGDLHLGTRVFGQRGTIVERPRPEVLHPVRCATAAFDEAEAWGAGRIVVKGDITNSGRPDQWRSYAKLVDRATVPVDALPGNHDYGHDGAVHALGPRSAATVFGVSMAQPITVRDLPGLRLVLVDSTRSGRNRGFVDAVRADLLDATSQAPRDGTVLVALHHQLQSLPLAEGWPIGVDHTSSVDLVDALGRCHPQVLVTSGHTHRHRRWDRAGVTVTQVGSTKDYPGVWAGYVVHEGGIRQVVRRVERPDCVAWTDQTRRAALGTWRWVAPGPRRSRCFNLVRPGR